MSEIKNVSYTGMARPSVTLTSQRFEGWMSVGCVDVLQQNVLHSARNSVLRLQSDNN